LAEEIARATGRRYALHELADGLLRVANATMVKAIRSISVAKGADPRHYLLVAFGGAAGQHACAVARELGMRQILNHPDAGVLSALGIGMADVVRHQAQGVYQPYSDEAVAALEPAFQRMAEEARREILAEGIPAERIEVRRSLDLRYQRLDAYLTIPEPTAGTYPEAYAAEHQKLYGYTHEGRPLEIVAARVEVVGHSGQEPPEPAAIQRRRPQPERTQATWFEGQTVETGVYRREDLRPGDVIQGPAVIGEALATTVIGTLCALKISSTSEGCEKRSSDSVIFSTTACR
jgi:5-oxoprolinase (ATP-hydrolysing)